MSIRDIRSRAGFQPRDAEKTKQCCSYAQARRASDERPDDIDLYQHVHSARYLEYVLAARFDRMERCYAMAMQAFAERGLGWFMAAATIQFRRSLGLGDRMTVRTWVERIGEIAAGWRLKSTKRLSAKRVCEGHCDYTLVTLATGRATALPDDVKAKYSI